MDLGLEGKRALVTGGSRGIGFATAKVMAAEGCRLVLVARDAERLEAAAAALPQGTDVAVTAADLADPGAAERLAAAYGDIDVLVNNAGAIPGGSLMDVDDATWRRAWDLKVMGYVAMTRAFYAAMRARGGGVVVNVIGAAADVLDPDYICGSTGNAALVAFTRALGSSSDRDGIRVVGINPGPVRTERMIALQRRRAEAQFGDPERWEELVTEMPFGRPADPEEIASLVAFLASPRSGYTSGAVLTVDGGKSIAGRTK